MRRYLTFIIAAVTAASCGTKPSDGEHVLHILTTNDVHGSYFDEPYVGNNAKNSLTAVKYYADSVRNAVGAENVLLIDAGDFLQGDNSAYYFNYIDTKTPHIYPRMAGYMGYDAICVGNHDIETGHPVYDRINRDLSSAGIPFLAGNAIRNDNGKPYFTPYAILHKAGLKVAVLGYTNANIKAWLDEGIWSGMSFESLIPKVQKDVDAIISKEKPQVVIAAIHSGTGEGDGSILESQGKDLFQSVKGVDFVVCSHDHRPVTLEGDGICLINSGSHCRFVGEGTATVVIKEGKVTSKQLSAGLIKVDAAKADGGMKAAFNEDYQAVKEFTLRKVGTLAMDLRTRDAFAGMCDYMNLIHMVCLRSSGADISFAAPLTYDGSIKAGELIFNDMFTIYPFENTLYVMELSGKEVKDYLEYSYDAWIQTIDENQPHALRIAHRDDPRTGQQKWSFINRSYNFDSAAGLCYTVDLTKPYGERISIASMASGKEFSEASSYKVAMTSYRASGGGNLLSDGAGMAQDKLGDRTIAKMPEIREAIYDFIKANGKIDGKLISDEAVLGKWSFIPESAGKALADDFRLLFE